MDTWTDWQTGWFQHTPKRFVLQGSTTKQFKPTFNSPGVEINFFFYLQKIASVMISNMLNEVATRKMKSMIFLYIIVNIINSLLDKNTKKLFYQKILLFFSPLYYCHEIYPEISWQWTRSISRRLHYKLKPLMTSAFLMTLCCYFQLCSVSWQSTEYFYWWLVPLGR